MHVSHISISPHFLQRFAALQSGAFAGPHSVIFNDICFHFALRSPFKLMTLGWVKFLPSLFFFFINQFLLLLLLLPSYPSFRRVSSSPSPASPSSSVLPSPDSRALSETPSPAAPETRKPPPFVIASRPFSHRAGSSSAPFSSPAAFNRAHPARPRQRSCSHCPLSVPRSHGAFPMVAH